MDFLDSIQAHRYAGAGSSLERSSFQHVVLAAKARSTPGRKALVLPVVPAFAPSSRSTGQAEPRISVEVVATAFLNQLVG